MNKHTLLYGQKLIEYKLLFINRKSLEISVQPDMSVIVKAPINSEFSAIEKKVKKRARWILKQIRYFQQFIPKTPKRLFISGETHLYLGKQYRLKIVQGKENSVKLSRGYFHIICSEINSPQKIKNLMDIWYYDKAEIHFYQSLEKCWINFKKFKIKKPEFSIKPMKKSWGSVSQKGNVTINLNLVKAPKECIDYVITHELCHLIHHNHSSEFYKLLSSLLPDWEKVKHKLELNLS